jgi:hypothetical protein
MKRLFLFWGAVSWGARLQMVAVALILGWYAWLDFQMGNWPVTIGIIVVAFSIAHRLKPVMIANSEMTHKIWSTFGVAFITTYFLAHQQWWWRTLLAHYVREFVMWLDFSCGYWFISELQLQQRESLELVPSNVDDHIRPAEGDDAENNLDDPDQSPIQETNRRH